MVIALLRSTVMNVKRFRWIIVVFLIISSGVLSWKYFDKRRFDFDESFNLQVPWSLVERQVYGGMYPPDQIYDVRITAGFPLHFLQAGFFLIFGVNDFAVRAMTFSLFLLTLLILYLLVKKVELVLLMLCLFFSSYAIRYTFVSYLGEITGMIMLLLACLALKKNNKTNRQIAISAVLMAMAVHSKFIYIFAAGLIVLSLIKWKDRLLFGVSSIIAFFVFYFVLVGGSYLVVNNGSTEGVFSYIGNHLNEYINKTLWLSNVGEKFDKTSIWPNLMLLKDQIGNGWVWLVVFLGGPLLVYRYIELLPLYLGIWYLTLKTTPGHALVLVLFMFFYILIKKNKFSLFILWVALMFGMVNVFRKTLSLENLYIWDRQVYRQQKEVAEIILKSDKPIFTNGWWQMPEISFLSNKSFGDITQTDMTKEKDVLLFIKLSQAVVWPMIDVTKTCAKTMYCVDDYLLCEYNNQFMFDPKAEPVLRKCEEMK